MKAIVYTQENTANDALETCNAEIPQGEARRNGSGIFGDVISEIPYTTILKHPTEDKWALMADEKVETILGVTAQDLDETWFPQNSLMTS
jgi:hypothetical protein